MTPTRAERVAGALAGLAIGDTLGGPLENHSAARIRETYPNGLGRLNPVGPATDDTEMALVTLGSLVERGGMDMEHMARVFLAWGRTATGLGPSTSAAVRALGAGSQWSVAGASATPSSGCLPRCAPLGLFLDRGALVAASVDCCIMTHRHPLAVAAVVALNVVLHALVRGESWGAALGAMGESGLDGAGDMAGLRAALAGARDAPGAVGVLREAVASTEGAADPREALLVAIAPGGDTDTRAACAGLLAGARWGLGAIPQDWLDACAASRRAVSLCAQWATG